MRSCSKEFIGFIIILKFLITIFGCLTASLVLSPFFFCLIGCLAGDAYHRACTAALFTDSLSCGGT